MDSLETLATFNLRWKAELARRWLTDEGIAAHLVSVDPEDTVSDRPLGSAAKDERLSIRPIESRLKGEGRVIVRVAHEDVDRANAVLALHVTDSEENEALPISGITDSPQWVSRKTDLDVEEPAESEQDIVAHKALLAAAIGIVIFPPLCHLYSLILLLGLSSTRGPLSERGRRSLIAAVIIDAVVIGVLLLILFLACGGFFEQKERVVRFH
jgi:hypothetical protein